MVGTHIFIIVFVATIHAGQSQNVKTEYECKGFHGAKIGKKVFGRNEFLKALAIALF